MRQILLLALLAGILLVQAGEPGGFAPAGDEAPAGRDGRITWSDGRSVETRISARPGLQIVLLPAGAARRVKIAWEKVVAITVEVAKEGMEEIWRWEAGGYDKKIYTGEKYPWRQYRVAVTTVDGQHHAGTLAAGFAVNADGGGLAGQIIISPKNKGETGQTLADWPFVREIVLTPPGAVPPLREGGEVPKMR